LASAIGPLNSRTLGVLNAIDACCFESYNFDQCKYSGCCVHLKIALIIKSLEVWLIGEGAELAAGAHFKNHESGDSPGRIILRFQNDGPLQRETIQKVVVLECAGHSEDRYQVTHSFFLTCFNTRSKKVFTPLGKTP